MHADYLRIRPRPRRNGTSTLAFMKPIRLAYPKRIRIYWIQDGLSCHWTPAIRAYADANNIELVPTPTYASYLNRIESHLRRDRRVRLQERRLPRLGRLRLALAEHVRHRNSPAARQRRERSRQTTAPRRLTHERVSQVQRYERPH